MSLEVGVGRENRPHRTVMTMGTVIMALISLLFGVACLLVAGSVEWFERNPGWQNVLNNLGGAVITSLALFSVWELWGRRAYTHEILETSQFANTVKASGVTKIGMEYLTDPDWNNLFQGTDKVDIFVAYANTWRNHNRTNLQRVVENTDGRVRVILPNGANDTVIDALANRFDMTAADLRQKIVDAVRGYEGIAKSAKGTVEIYLHDTIPLFSCYRLDNSAVLTPYTHRQDRMEVPTIVCKGGSLYQWIRQEFDVLLKTSTQVFPNDKRATHD